MNELETKDNILAYYDFSSQGRLHGKYAFIIGVDILKGVYSIGSFLPTEIEASANLHISRTAYREAIRILAAKGLVESRPKLGTRVTEKSRWNLLDPEVLGWMFVAKPSAEFINGLFELRMINEPAAAELAALRRTEDQLAAMSKMLLMMKTETLKTEKGRKADMEFHKLILEATKNEALASLNFTISAAVAWTTRFKQTKGDNFRDPIDDHYAVYEAIKAKDAKGAKEAMVNLISLALLDTKSLIE